MPAPAMTTTTTSSQPGPEPDDRPAPATDGNGLHQPGDVAGEAHGPDDHGESHGHDDHAHTSDALGPIDVQAWGALLVGVGAGLLIVFCLVLTTTILA